MVSGTDEHGTPITVQAEQEGVTPQELADRYNTVIGDAMLTNPNGAPDRNVFGRETRRIKAPRGRRLKFLVIAFAVLQLLTDPLECLMQKRRDLALFVREIAIA